MKSLPTSTTTMPIPHAFRASMVWVIPTIAGTIPGTTPGTTILGIMVAIGAIVLGAGAAIMAGTIPGSMAIEAIMATVIGIIPTTTIMVAQAM